MLYSFYINCNIIILQEKQAAGRENWRQNKKPKLMSTSKNILKALDLHSNIDCNLTEFCKVIKFVQTVN